MARLTLRLDFGPGRAIGHGKIRLLEAVRDHGSISAAGRSMGMSYRRAWLLVDALNRLFKAPVVETKHGGSAGGGAELTPFGHHVAGALKGGHLAMANPDGVPPCCSSRFVKRRSGKVKHPLRLSVDVLRKLPAERAEVSFQTARGIEKSSYTGVLLWTLLGEAGGIDDSAKGAELRHTISITGRDGYNVVVSTGEIAPDFGGKAAMIAYERDGEEFGDKGLRVVMPGDKHGGRYVRDVVEIEVK
jgi:molybdate transport system regulatory protein